MDCARLAKAREHVAVARHATAGSIFDISQRTEAIVFELEEPVWMAKGLAEARQAHGFVLIDALSLTSCTRRKLAHSSRLAVRGRLQPYANSTRSSVPHVHTRAPVYSRLFSEVSPTSDGTAVSFSVPLGCRMLFAHKNKPWFTLYEGGLLELDWQRLSERIVLAKQAIGERWQQLEGSKDQHQERERLADAANALRLLEAEVSRHLPKRMRSRLLQ
jgi:hypothetical protein